MSTSRKNKKRTNNKKKGTRKNYRKWKVYFSTGNNKNQSGGDPEQSKDNTMPEHCKGKPRKLLRNYCNNPNVTDKKCECVPGSPQNKKAMKKQSAPQSDKTPCKSKSCCKNKTCAADVETCDKPDLVPCPKMPGCKLKKVSTPEGMRDRCQFEPQTEPTQPAKPIKPKKKKKKKTKTRVLECLEENASVCTKKNMVCDMTENKCVAKPKKTPRLKAYATRVGKQAVARNIAARAGENFVGLFSNIKSKNGDDLIDPESLQPYGDWVKGTVASGAWKGEEFAYNKKTGEYIIYSQHVKQDDCEPCEWVLYPSVKYGTDKKIGFANIPGTLWYWNTIKEDWYEEVPDGVTFDQAESKEVQDKLYGKKKSPDPAPAPAPTVTPSDKTPCKSKSCCKNKTCHADVETCDKPDLVPCPKMPGCKLKKVSTPEGMRDRCQFEPQTEPTQPKNGSDALNKFKKAGKTVGKQAVVVKRMKENLEQSEEEKAQEAAQAAQAAALAAARARGKLKKAVQGIKSWEKQWDRFMGHGVTPFEESLLVK